MKIEKVALIGAGAVGAYFIWGLTDKLKENFTIIANGKRRARLLAEGVIINDKTYFPKVSEAKDAGKVDLVLLACKQDALFEVMEDIKLLTGPDTMVISLLNGVTSEEIIGNAIGYEHMLYSVMRIASQRVDNKIVFDPQATLGVFAGEKDIYQKTDRIKAIAELFDGTGIRFTYVEDIIKELWLKYAANVSQNLPQAILSVGFGAYIDSDHVRTIAKELWKEVAAVARAKGIEIGDEFRQFAGSNMKARFSTLQDLDAGRHTEIEIFAGDMMRMGKDLGISVPYCEYTYHLIKALEEKNDGKFNYETGKN